MSPSLLDDATLYALADRATYEPALALVPCLPTRAVLVTPESLAGLRQLLIDWQGAFARPGANGPVGLPMPGDVLCFLAAPWDDADDALLVVRARAPGAARPPHVWWLLGRRSGAWAPPSELSPEMFRRPRETWGREGLVTPDRRLVELVAWQRLVVGEDLRFHLETEPEPSARYGLARRPAGRDRCELVGAYRCEACDLALEGAMTLGRRNASSFEAILLEQLRRRVLRAGCPHMPRAVRY